MAPLTRNRSYLNIAYAIFFFGFALLLNVYVTLTVHSSSLTVQNPFVNENDYVTTNITAGSPSLAIVSACIPGERFPTEYVNMSQTNKLHYCKRYNAKCILPTTRVDNQSDLHTKWDKLYYINRTMHTEQVDWVLWMDCDTAFTNFEIYWYTHLRKHLNTSQLMVVAKDVAGINLGVFLVPNTQISRGLIQAMYKLRFQLDKQFFHKDQSALKHLIKKNPQMESRIEIVDRELMNTYLDNNEGEAWVPYHWIMHQVFCNDLVGCMANFTRVMKMVTPQYY